MKRRELIKLLKNVGFKFYRSGGKHDIYARDNDREQIPRHREINENLADAIIKKWDLRR